MKFKRARKLLIVPLTFLLFSCGNKPTPAPGPEPSPGPEPTPEPIPDPTPTPHEVHEDANADGYCDICGELIVNPESYEKDNEGFYILEENYYNNSKHVKENAFITKGVADQPRYSNFRMFIGDESVPLYLVKTNFSQTWNGNTQTRMNNAVATIGIKGEIEIKLQTNFKFGDEVTIRPLSTGIEKVVDESRRVLTFKIKEAGQYTIEFKQDRCLHLFVNNYDDMNYDYSGQNIMVFEPGIHNKDNDSRINSSNVIELQSNTIVYICPDAFIEAKFLAVNKSNIKIFGCGYIDGQYFERDQTKGTATVPIEFNYCNNIDLEDFSVIDPAGWCFNIYFTNDSLIKNCKVISSRSNGDGISIQSCQRINVENCFVRSWDDSLVVKNYKRWDNGNLGYTDTIKFKNCILWTDLAQSMEIGFETVGEHMENISFENITVLHNFHKAIFSIHNGNNAKIRNVSYKNIVVEDASVGKGDGSNVLLQFQNVYSTTWSDQYGSYPLGDINGITMENIEVLSGIASPNIEICGCVDPRSSYSKEPHYIRNVSINNFKLYGKYLEKEGIVTNYLENLTVTHE